MTASAQASRGAGRARASELGSRYGLVIIMFLVIALFSVMLPETYFTVLNFLTIAANQATILMLALAIVLPLIAGEFDLSVAATFGFCQLVIAGFIIRNGLPWEVAVLLTLGVGAVVGLANGLLITVLQINSFIATLGTATILGGLTQWYSGGAIIMGQFPSFYLAIGQFRIGGTLNVAVVYAVLIAFVMWAGLVFLVAGRHLYATGGGRAAAELAGVRTGRLKIGAFIVCGILAAATGVVTSSQIGSGQPSLGASYLLPAYAGAFLGATTVNPGRFNVWGTVVAVYLLGAGVAGLQQLGIQSFIVDLFNGAALILAVAASGYVTRRRAARVIALSDERVAEAMARLIAAEGSTDATGPSGSGPPPAEPPPEGSSR